MRQYFAPSAFQRLPLLLQRDKLYPARPEAVAVAAQDYLDGSAPQTMLPQNMVYTRWKSDMPYGSNVVGLMMALQGEMEFRQNMAAAQRQAPQYNMRQASEGLNRIPEASPVNSTQYGSRDVTPLDQLITVDQLEAYVNASEENSNAAAAVAQASKSTAMTEIRAKQQAYAGIVRVPEQTPWSFVRNNG